MTHYKGNSQDTGAPKKRPAHNAPEHEAAKRSGNSDAPKNMPESLRREPNHPENPAGGRDDPLKPDR